VKEIPLTQGRVALVDDEDYEWLNQWKWYYDKKGRTGYAVRDSVGRPTLRKQVRMHRLIMDAPQGLEVDHINGIGTDNQRGNLRLCTHKQNRRNTRMCAHNTSGYKGVHWDKARQKWFAQIHIDDWPHFLGRYLEIEDAAKAYDAAAREIYGEFACLNFPKGGERKCQ